MTAPTTMEKYRAFVELHNRPLPFVVPNPWNAGTARILENLGFEALATTSAGFAFSIGRLDSQTTLTRAEIVQNAREIVSATNLPVTADLEGGFGDAPDDCAETIGQAAAAGLIGGSIEDATGNPDKPIYDFEHACERIAAAVEAAADVPFFLTARAESYLYLEPKLDDVILRLQAFEKAGASVLYAPGLPSLDAIRTVCSSVSKPVNVVMGLAGATYSVDELADAGVKRISVGGSFARAALGAFVRAARETRDMGTFGYSEDAIGHDEVTRLVIGTDQN